VHLRRVLHNSAHVRNEYLEVLLPNVLELVRGLVALHTRVALLRLQERVHHSSFTSTPVSVTTSTSALILVLNLPVLIIISLVLLLRALSAVSVYIFVTVFLAVLFRVVRRLPPREVTWYQ